MSEITALPRPRRAAIGVGLLFASNGALFASLLPWYPLLAGELRLEPATFGLIVAAFATGALVSSALPTPLVRRFGALPVAVVGTVLLGLAVATAGWASQGWMLAAAIFVAGLFDAVVDVAQNVVGIRVQDRAGRSILSSMHAMWSLGGAAGGAAATAAAASGADIRVALAVAVGACVVLVSIGAALIGPGAAPAPEAPPASTAAPRARWGAVAVVALPLVAIAVCGTMVEDVANNWAALSGERLAGIPADTAGLVFTIVIASQCVGRFTGDPLIQRIGRARVARLGGALIAAGGVAVVCATEPVLLCVGFAVAGFGCATLVPSALTAAARIPGLSDGAGVTLVSWLMRVGFLVTSPAIGLVTQALDLRVGLALLILVGVAALLLAGRLADRPA
jgi:MFS family permease